MFKLPLITVLLSGCLLLDMLQAAQAMRLYRYTNEQGETVISNVPPKCIKDARLTCMERHPVAVGQPGVKPAATQKKSRPAKTAAKPGRSSRKTAAKSTQPGQTASRNSQPLFNMLDQVVEVNKLLDEYYPGAPDPGTAAQVREQQQDIMDVLQVIRGVADDDDQSTIDRAIEVFRSNLAE